MHCPSRVGTGPETGGKIFDPYGFSTMGGDKALAFFRHAEIKHGRVAMAGVVGLLVHINHIHFDGYLSPTFGVSFADLSAMGPFDAWNAVPLLGQLQASAAPATADPCCVYLSTRAGGGALAGNHNHPHPHPHPHQIIFTIAGLEHASECLDPAGHYTKGGEPGNLKFLKNCAPPPPPSLPPAPPRGRRGPEARRAPNLMPEMHPCLCGATSWPHVVCRMRMLSDWRVLSVPAVWDTPGFTKKLSSQQLAEKRLSEIKNGRLAMIGMVRRPGPRRAPRPQRAAASGLSLHSPSSSAPMRHPPSPCRVLHTLTLTLTLARRPSAPRWPSRAPCRCSRTPPRSRAPPSRCPSAPSKLARDLSPSS